MRRVDWGEVSAAGFPVPADPPLPELTAELTELLGHAEAKVRESIALRTLTVWLHRGVYDDLLPGLGDGMADGLANSTTPVRRGCSATVLGECIARDDAERRVPTEKVLAWGDRLVTWWTRENQAEAIIRGADAVATLAAHPACSGSELAVLLDVAGERAQGVTDHDTADRLAHTTHGVLRRGLVPTDVVEAWLGRLEDSPAYLQALYVHLSLAPMPPPERADLLLLVVDRLRAVHPDLRTASRDRL